MAAYHAGNAPMTPDGRLFSHVFDRNGPPIIAALTPWLAQRSGAVLEIGSGTGQHAGACALAFPGLFWQPSDREVEHRKSVAAWAAHLRLESPAPLDLDASTDWAARDDVRALGPLNAVVSMNVIHIAPFAVTRGLVAGAGKALAPGGLLIFYGPFKINGAHVGRGNAAFDAGLRGENPEWGIRESADVQALGAEVGLGFAGMQAMPANNRLLVLRKT